jgi:hypothetical protein
MKRFITLFALSAFAFSFFVAGASLSAQEKYTLKNAYLPGQYEMVLTTDMDMTMEMPGGAKMPMKQTQTQHITIDAAEKSADGTQKVVMEVTRFAMTQKMAFGEMKYDSADPDADKSPMKAAGVVVGMKITITFDKDGKPVKYSGIDDFFKKLTDNPDFPKQAAEMLKEQMTDENMGKSFDLSRDMMPTTAVAVGETWKTEGSAEIPMLGKTKTDVENTLKEVKTESGRKIAEILSKSIMRSEEPKKMDTMGVSMTVTKVDINVETTTLLDIESGLLKKSTAETNMAFEMSMDAPDGQVLTQKISGKGKTTTTITPKSR